MPRALCWHLARSLVCLACLSLAACGPLQVGVEEQAGAAAPAAPSAGAPLAPTVAALQTENARLATAVATLSAPRPQPTPGPLAPPLRIAFARGSASATFGVDLAPGVPQWCIISVLGGQRLSISADHSLQVQVFGPDGHLLVPVSARPQQWEYAVAQTGDESIALIGSGHATVTIYVPPLAPAGR